MEKINKNLVEQLCELNKCTPTLLHQYIRQNYEKNLKYIKSGILKTNHLKKNNVITPDFITNRPSARLFSHRGYKHITVDQYYFIKHKLDLKYPNLPCIAIIGGGTHKTYYPLEVLEFFDVDDLKIM